MTVPESSSPASRTSVARQAAADVEQVIRGKRWLQRVTELADSVTVDRDRAARDREPRDREPRVREFRRRAS